MTSTEDWSGHELAERMEVVVVWMAVDGGSHDEHEIYLVAYDTVTREGALVVENHMAWV